MVANLNTLVQKIVVQADTKGVDSLNNALSKLKSQARSVANSFSKMITPEQRIALAKANEIITHNNARIAEARALTQQHNAVISQNNAIISQNTKERVMNTNAYMQATQATQLKLSADKRDIQLSRERIAELRKETAERRNATNAIKTQSSAMLGLKSVLGYFVGIHTVFSFIRDAREIDLMQRSMQGLTKTTQDWEYIQQQAFRTGTNIKDAARGYRNFYASASMAGFGKGSIQGMYADLLTSTRAIGATPTQTQGALLALEQMISKGVVSMEELRRQLGNALPGAFEIGARAMKMTTAEFNEFVKKGQLASTVFVPKFIEQLKKEYAGGFAEATKSIDFALQNLTNSWLIFVDSVTKGDVGKSFAQAINALSVLITDPDFLYMIQLLGKVLGLIFTFVRKTVNFTRKHLPIILGLLGMAGLAGGLLKIKNLMIAVASLLVTIQQYAFTTGLTLNAAFGKVMLANIKSFALGIKSALTPLIAMHAWIAGIISLILIWQDLWVSVFGGKDRTTLGRYWAAKKGKELGEGRSKLRAGFTLGGSILGGIATFGNPLGIAAGAGFGYGAERGLEGLTGLLLDSKLRFTSPNVGVGNSAGTGNIELNKNSSVVIENVFVQQSDITNLTPLTDAILNVTGG